MIEEPKEPGFYWIRASDKTDIADNLQGGGYWSIIGADAWFTWSELSAEFGHIIAIEPVTPPSWERNP